VSDKLITIGESIHASIPKTGSVMKGLLEAGPDAYSRPSEQLDYIRDLIEVQAREGADYIAVNVDAFGEEDAAIARRLIVQYVRLVRQWVCIDSSDDETLIAGLKEWYNTDQPVKPPLVNSIKVYTADNMMPLKKKYDFSFVGLLMSEEKPSGPGGSHSVDELYTLARQLFDKAVNEYGFKPHEIFFDSTVFPLAIDMPMEPGVPGRYLQGLRSKGNGIRARRSHRQRPAPLRRKTRRPGASASCRGLCSNGRLRGKNKRCDDADGPVLRRQPVAALPPPRGAIPGYAVWPRSGKIICRCFFWQLRLSCSE